MLATLATINKLRTDPAETRVLFRADSAFSGRGTVLAAVRAGAQVLVTVPLDPRVKAAITVISTTLGGDGVYERSLRPGHRFLERLHTRHQASDSQ